MTAALSVYVSTSSPGSEWDRLIGTLPAGRVSGPTGWADLPPTRGHETTIISARMRR